MQEQEKTSPPYANGYAPASNRAEQEVVPNISPITRSTAHAVVIKDEDLFFLSETDGNVPLEEGHGFGLYYHDCRYLKAYELRLAGLKAEPLVWTAEQGFQAILGLTNPVLPNAEGGVVDNHTVEIKWSRMIESGNRALYDVLTFHNLGFQLIDFTVSLSFQSSFEDVFTVRGAKPERRGRLIPPSWRAGSLSFSYDGADSLHRSLNIHFDPEPGFVEGTTARFRIRLSPKESRQIRVSLLLNESSAATQEQPHAGTRLELERVERALRQSLDEWLESETEVGSDSLTLNKVMDRSLRDLRVLRSHVGNVEYFAAGVPWFVALFGRDSIITAIQALAYNPDIAEQTLRLLAGYQGRQVNEWKEEEPGKILHELRVGEMARLGEIPHTPYYGTIDATPLFLILVGRHAAWTGDLSLFNDLRASIEMALDWITSYGDADRNGFVEYSCKSEKGLANQGWKDSTDCIVNSDGSLATPPIELVEVQGYVYDALVMMADLYTRSGEADRARGLTQQAERLRERFNREFWLEDGYYALALQRGGRPAAVLSSNAGHALWSGIADQEKARLTAERLMGPDMFNGWGIRTLSAKEICYNPLGYHLGTVWPHDNSLIAAGFRRYNLDEAALCVFKGMVEAAAYFDGHRLPELFAGFAKDDYGIPVSYPVACRPQAWAAGTVPYMLKTMIGFAPEAFDKRLRIRRPLLPDFVNHLEVRRLRVGGARADLRFDRTGERVEVTLLKVEGQLDVSVEY